MSTQEPYAIHVDPRYAPLERIDLQELVNACRDPWYNQTLCRVNDCAQARQRRGVLLCG